MRKIDKMPLEQIGGEASNVAALNRTLVSADQAVKRLDRDARRRPTTLEDARRMMNMAERRWPPMRRSSRTSEFAADLSKAAHRCAS
jgi:hypothetical protein